MAIIFSVVIMSIALLLFFFGDYFTYWLIRIFYLKDGVIVVPSFFACNGGVLIFVCILFLTCLNIEGLMPFFVAVTIVTFYGTFLSFSIIKDDKIIHRSIFHSFGKVYSYDDIIKVQVFVRYNYRLPDWGKLRYIIEMKDRTKIDINTLQLQKRPIRDKKGTISLKNIFSIESKIGRYIPHTITSDAYHELNSSYVNLTDDFRRKFKIKQPRIS